MVVRYFEHRSRWLWILYCHYDSARDCRMGLAERCHRIFFIHDAYRMYHKWARNLLRSPSAFQPEPTYAPTINIPSRNVGLANRPNQMADCLGKSKNAKTTEHVIGVRHETQYSFMQCWIDQSIQSGGRLSWKSMKFETTEHKLEVRHEHEYRPAYEASNCVYLLPNHFRIWASPLVGCAKLKYWSASQPKALSRPIGKKRNLSLCRSPEGGPGGGGVEGSGKQSDKNIHSGY